MGLGDIHWDFDDLAVEGDDERIFETLQDDERSFETLQLPRLDDNFGFMDDAACFQPMEDLPEPTVKVQVQEAPKIKVVKEAVPEPECEQPVPPKAMAPSKSSKVVEAVEFTKTPPSKGRTKKNFRGCNCRKSKCLKLYCDCFAMKRQCGLWCRCDDCHNTGDYKHEDLRQRSVSLALVRNKTAFKTPVSALTGSASGCRCKRSRCQKNYCECFQAGVPCSSLCKCDDCENGSCGEHKRRPKQGAKRAASFTDTDSYLSDLDEQPSLKRQCSREKAPTQVLKAKASPEPAAAKPAAPLAGLDMSKYPFVMPMMNPLANMASLQMAAMLGAGSLPLLPTMPMLPNLSTMPNLSAMPDLSTMPLARMNKLATMPSLATMQMANITSMMQLATTLAK